MIGTNYIGSFKSNNHHDHDGPQTIGRSCKFIYFASVSTIFWLDLEIVVISRFPFLRQICIVYNFSAKRFDICKCVVDRSNASFWVFSSVLCYDDFDNWQQFPISQFVRCGCWEPATKHISPILSSILCVVITTYVLRSIQLLVLP